MPDNLSKRLYFFARQIHSLVHLILKFQKYNMDYPFFFFFILDVNSFYETENPTRCESPSSVSRENNCVKTEFNQGKLNYV